MPDSKLRREIPRMVNIKQIDTKEFELPETLFISDIDTRVIQGIVLQCLSQIDGIALVAGTFIDNILGRSGPAVGSGILSEQDSKNHSINIKIEVNICYGIPIFTKSEEIQTKVVEEITRLTGLRVSAMHVVFKDIIATDQAKSLLSNIEQAIRHPNTTDAGFEEEYSDNF